MKSGAILICDLEEAVRESLQFILSEEGFSCFTVTSEMEALKILDTKSISLVILDHDALEIIDFLEKIKQTYPKTKILIISSYYEVDSTQLALAQGADDFILEPLDFDELLAQIKELLLPLAG